MVEIDVDQETEQYIENFGWSVYTEMLELVDRELQTDGFQSRIPNYELKELLRIPAVDSTDEFPFLSMALDLRKDDYLLEGNIIHETAHHVVRHIVEENYTHLINDKLPRSNGKKYKISEEAGAETVES